MNKKFFSLLLVAVSLFSVSTLESCKDTSTDLYNQISMKHSEDYKKLSARIDALEASIGNAGDCGVDCAALKAEVEALKTKLNNLPESATPADLAALETKVGTLETSLKDLIAKVDGLANQATSITVQSVYTPAFGTINTPFGIQSNVLVAYYGDVEGVEFGSEYYEGEIVSNPGKVYLTVDPSNVNFSGLNVNLVGNKKNAGFDLSALAVTEDGINAGITRATANYLYVTEASVKSVADAQKLSLNTDKFKSAAKTLLNKEINLTELANLVYSTIKSVNGVELNAVQLVAGDRALVSKYDIAAVAVEPLNLTMMEAAGSVLAEKDIQGKIEKAVEKVVGSVPSAVEKILNKVMPYTDRLANIGNPALFAEDGETLRLLSTDPKHPTVLDNSKIKLIPSSYSLELVVPFYKKLVSSDAATIKVNGADANGKVVDGSTMEADVIITSSETAAIKYRVLDYAGNKSKTITYYVKVK